VEGLIPVGMRRGVGGHNRTGTSFFRKDSREPFVPNGTEKRASKGMNAQGERANLTQGKIVGKDLASKNISGGESAVERKKKASRPAKRGCLPPERGEEAKAQQSLKKKRVTKKDVSYDSKVTAYFHRREKRGGLDGGTSLRKKETVNGLHPEEKARLLRTQRKAVGGP